MATKPEIERLAVLETKVDNIGSDVKDIKDHLALLDNKYAPKWVQTAVTFVVGLVISAVIMAGLAFLLVKPTPTTTTTDSAKSSTTQTSPTTSNGSTTTKETTNNTTTNTTSPASDSTSGGVHVELPKL